MKIREEIKIARAGKRWALTRITKIGRLVELKVRLPGTHASRLEAKARAGEQR